MGRLITRRPISLAAVTAVLILVAVLILIAVLVVILIAVLILVLVLVIHSLFPPYSFLR